MTTTELLRILRSHRGEVCVAALCRNDVFYVKVVKSDLIDNIARGDLGPSLSWSIKDGTGYIDTD